MSYETAATVFLNEWRDRTRPKTLIGYRLYLNRFGFQKNVSEITRGNIHSVLAMLKDKPAAQNQAFTVMRLFFNWALRNELVDKHPMRGERRPATVSSHDRVLTEPELTAVLCGATSCPFGTIVRLLVLTGQRRGETGALRWDRIDEEEQPINLPSSTTKNKRAHNFPYGSLTKSVLAAIPRCSPLLSSPLLSSPLLSSSNPTKAQHFRRGASQKDTSASRLKFQRGRCTTYVGLLVPPMPCSAHRFT